MDAARFATKDDAAPLQELTQHLNFEFWAGDREVCVVNDNAGQLFQFEKLARGETWVTQEAVNQILSGLRRWVRHPRLSAFGYLVNSGGIRRNADKG